MIMIMIQGFQNKLVTASVPLAAWLLTWIELNVNVDADLVCVQSSNYQTITKFHQFSRV